MSDRERADRLERMLDRMAETIVNLRGELFFANELLRSVNSVITRRGAETNWDALGHQVRVTLEEQYRVLRYRNYP